MEKKENWVWEWMEISDLYEKRKKMEIEAS